MDATLSASLIGSPTAFSTAIKPPPGLCARSNASPDSSLSVHVPTGSGFPPLENPQLSADVTGRLSLSSVPSCSPARAREAARDEVDLSTTVTCQSYDETSVAILDLEGMEDSSVSCFLTSPHAASHQPPALSSASGSNPSGHAPPVNQPEVEPPAAEGGAASSANEDEGSSSTPDGAVATAIPQLLLERVSPASSAWDSALPSSFQDHSALPSSFRDQSEVGEGTELQEQAGREPLSAPERLQLEREYWASPSGQLALQQLLHIQPMKEEEEEGEGVVSREDGMLIEDEAEPTLLREAVEFSQFDPTHLASLLDQESFAPGTHASSQTLPTEPHPLSSSLPLAGPTHETLHPATPPYPSATPPYLRPTQQYGQSLPPAAVVRDKGASLSELDLPGDDESNEERAGGELSRADSASPDSLPSAYFGPSSPRDSIDSATATYLGFGTELTLSQTSLEEGEPELKDPFDRWGGEEGGEGRGGGGGGEVLNEMFAASGTEGASASGVYNPFDREDDASVGSFHDMDIGVQDSDSFMAQLVEEEEVVRRENLFPLPSSSSAAFSEFSSATGSQFIDSSGEVSISAYFHKQSQQLGSISPPSSTPSTRPHFSDSNGHIVQSPPTDPAHEEHGEREEGEEEEEEEGEGEREGSGDQTLIASADEDAGERDSGAGVTIRRPWSAELTPAIASLTPGPAHSTLPLLNLSRDSLAPFLPRHTSTSYKDVAPPTSSEATPTAVPNKRVGALPVPASSSPFLPSSQPTPSPLTSSQPTPSPLLPSQPTPSLLTPSQPTPSLLTLSQPTPSPLTLSRPTPSTLTPSQPSPSPLPPSRPTPSHLPPSQATPSHLTPASRPDRDSDQGSLSRHGSEVADASTLFFPEVSVASLSPPPTQLEGLSHASTPSPARLLARLDLTQVDSFVKPGWEAGHEGEGAWSVGRGGVATSHRQSSLADGSDRSLAVTSLRVHKSTSVGATPTPEEVPRRSSLGRIHKSVSSPETEAARQKLDALKVTLETARFDAETFLLSLKKSPKASRTPSQHTSSPPPPRTPSQHTSGPPPPLTPSQHTSSPPPPLTPSQHTSSPPPPLTPSQHTSSPPPPLTPSQHTSSPPPPRTLSQHTSSPPPPLTPSQDKLSGEEQQTASKKGIRVSSVSPRKRSARKQVSSRGQTDGAAKRSPPKPPRTGALASQPAGSATHRPRPGHTHHSPKGKPRSSSHSHDSRVSFYSTIFAARKPRENSPACERTAATDEGGLPHPETGEVQSEREAPAATVLPLPLTSPPLSPPLVISPGSSSAFSRSLTLSPPTSLSTSPLHASPTRQPPPAPSQPTAEGVMATPTPSDATPTTPTAVSEQTVSSVERSGSPLLPSSSPLRPSSPPLRPSSPPLQPSSPPRRLSFSPQEHSPRRQQASPVSLAPRSSIKLTPPPNQVAGSVVGVVLGPGGVVLGPGAVELPETLSFECACCVGASLVRELPLTNTTERWVQMSLAVGPVYRDGTECSDGSHCIFQVPQKCFIEPNTTIAVKVRFGPASPGSHETLLTAHTSLVGGGGGGEGPTLSVILRALAESPCLDLVSVALDYGVLVAGTSVSHPLKLANHGTASLPLFLSVPPPYFSFGEVPSSLLPSSLLPSSRPCPIYSSTSSVSILLPPRPHGQSEPMLFEINVNFKAPKRFTQDSSPPGSPEQISQELEISVDSASAPGTLCSVPLRAVVGVAMLHVPRALQAISLSCSEGQEAARDIPFKNAGNIPLHVRFQVSPDSAPFSASPTALTIPPAKEGLVSVRFSPPSVPLSSEGCLHVHVEPSGPGYELKLRGTAIPAEKPQKEMLLCSKRALYWGGVHLNQPMQLKVVLHSSFRSAVRLMVSLRHNDSMFQLQTSGSLTPSLRSHEVDIRPQEQLPVCVIFTPTALTVCFNDLDIYDTAHDRKYRIPLCGYGGTSCVEVAHARTSPDGLWLPLQAGAGQCATARLSVHNSGERAAFARVLCYTGTDSSTASPPTSLHLTPDKLLLPPYSAKEVVLTVSAGAAHTLSPHSPAAVLEVVSGDEMVRHRLIRGVAGAELQSSLNEAFVRGFPEQLAESADLDLTLFQVEDEERFFEQQLRRLSVSVQAPPTYSEEPLGAKVSVSSAHLSELPHAPAMSPPHARAPLHPSHTPTTVTPLAPTPHTPHVLSSHAVLLPDTLVGHSSGSHLELCNPHPSPLHWKLGSRAPPFVRNVGDGSSDIYKATYSAFWVGERHGVIPPHSAAKVSVIFQPHDRGSFSQIWNVQVSCGELPPSDLRVSFGGKALLPPATAAPQKNHLRSTHPSAVSLHSVPSGRRVYIHRSDEMMEFPVTPVGSDSTIKVRVCNKDAVTHKFKVIKPSPPFYTDHQHFELSPRLCARVPVHFHPSSLGAFEGVLAVSTHAGHQTFSLLKASSSSL